MCEDIVTPGLRDSCYLKLFRATGDSTGCERIGDPNLNSLCTGDAVRGGG